MERVEPQFLEQSLLAIALAGTPVQGEVDCSKLYCEALMSSIFSCSVSAWRQFSTCFLFGSKASRGEILKARRHAGVTLISGMGHWYQGELYLVPNDVFDLEDKSSLVPLTGWPGAVVLDLWVGDELDSYAQWLMEKGPINFIACLYRSKDGYMEGQVPGKNTFVQLWGEGFSGVLEALDHQRLTLSSLSSYLGQCQVPVLYRGQAELADFSKGIFDPNGFLQAQVQSLSIREERPLRVKEVLTEIKHWHLYTEKQVEYAVNHNLGPYLSVELGEKAAKLRQALRLLPDEVQAEENEIIFLSGLLTFEYRSSGKKNGDLWVVLGLESYWLKHLTQIQVMIAALRLECGVLVLGLSCIIEPKDLIPGLQAQAWNLDSETQLQVIATKGEVTLRVEPDCLEVSGIQIDLLLDGDTNGAYLKEVLLLL